MTKSACYSFWATCLLVGYAAMSMFCLVGGFGVCTNLVLILLVSGRSSNPNDSRLLRWVLVHWFWHADCCANFWWADFTQLSARLFCGDHCANSCTDSALVFAWRFGAINVGVLVAAKILENQWDFGCQYICTSSTACCCTFPQWCHNFIWSEIIHLMMFCGSFYALAGIAASARWDVSTGSSAHEIQANALHIQRRWLRGQGLIQTCRIALGERLILHAFPVQDLWKTVTLHTCYPFVTQRDILHKSANLRHHLVGDFRCVNFGGVCQGFSSRIFLGTSFSQKMRQIRSDQNRPCVMSRCSFPSFAMGAWQPNMLDSMASFRTRRNQKALNTGFLNTGFGLDNTPIGCEQKNIKTSHIRNQRDGQHCGCLFSFLFHEKNPHANNLFV